VKRGNENKKDNRPENLEVMTNSDHAKLHGADKERTFVVLKCPSCKCIFEREKRQTYLSKPGSSYTCCSRSCRGKFSRNIQLNGESEETKKLILENFVRDGKLN
jgi:hypothetical protein